MNRHSKINRSGSIQAKILKVCIILPFRNEATHLRSCLEGLLGFRVPKGIEVTILCMDGGSTDGSEKVLGKIAECHPNIKTMANPRAYQGCAVNMAVRSVPADAYLWLGAHTQFPADYLENCLETRQRTGAEVVGGVCVTLPGGESYGAKVVQAMTTHKFGVGDSGFRIGAREGIKDTVPYALFAKEVFSRGGYLDERLVRAQDYEFNRRLSRMGMRIWLNPKIFCFYRNQSSFWSFMKKQIFLEAPFNSYMWYLAPYAFQPRHAVTGIFAVGVVGGIIVSFCNPLLRALFLSTMFLYGVLAVGAALQQARRYREWWHAFVLPVCFFLFHLGHGLGTLQGLFRLATGNAPVQRAPEPWPGAGFKRIPKAWFQQTTKTDSLGPKPESSLKPSTNIHEPS